MVNDHSTHSVQVCKRVATQIVRRATPRAALPFRFLYGRRRLAHAVDIKKEIGRRIADARKAKGWSQAKLSEKTDYVLSASRIANYEQGIRRPGPKEARILAKPMDADPAHLLCLDGGEMTDEERTLLRAWRALPERDRLEYLRRINALALAYRDPVPDEKVDVPKKRRNPLKRPTKT